MAFQAVPDTAEAVIEFFGNTVTAKNVIHAVKPGGYNLADLTILADIVDGNVGAAWLDEISRDYLYVQTTVRGLAFVNDQEVIVNTSSAIGRQLADALPGNVTFAVKRPAASPGAVLVVDCSG